MIEWPKWESAKWESAKWESAKWESAKWESVKWESAKCESVKWESAKWESAKWQSALEHSHRRVVCARLCKDRMALPTEPKPNANKHIVKPLIQKLLTAALNGAMALLEHAE
jgi:hypothetical protein